MRIATFAALLLLLLAGAVTIPLRHAGAQDAPAPPKAEGGPPRAPEAAPAPAPAAPSSTVTHSNVNLRGGPGTNYALLRLIRAGSPVDVKECKNGWCQVVFQSTDGYIIESSIAPNAFRTRAKPRFRPMPGYVGPPPAYNMRPFGHYPPPPYYYYRPYYLPYWGWRRAYWW